MEEELARAMGGLKKTVNLEVKEKPKQLSMAEQLAASRAKLRKAVVAPKPPPEKKVDPRDLLRRQIQLRHANLKMHEDESDSDSEKSQDSF